MLEQAYYFLFAGINGAGKTTLFRSGQWMYANSMMDIPRINSDEILVEQGGDWRSTTDQIRAGREAVRRVHHYLNTNTSFNQETTLAGKTIINTIREAQRLGYWVIMNYVGVESPSIANGRIAHRTRVGGHGIEPELVERRWKRSLANLERCLDICDEIRLYDNTSSLTLLDGFYFGKHEDSYADPHGITWHLPIRKLMEEQGRLTPLSGFPID